MEKNNKTKFNNIVYYSICEISTELFKKNTDYQTYSNFCKTLKASIIRHLENEEANPLSKKETKILITISDRIELLYSLSEEEIDELLTNYFMEDQFLIFEKPVAEMYENFRNSIN